MGSVRFEILPIALLKPHERVRDDLVEELVHEIRAADAVVDPVWVEARDHVILNGHHRYAALLRLGAERVPAYVVDYDDPEMELGRWESGPPLRKAEVVDRARNGDLYPPKTSRHIWRGPLPKVRPTPLARLLGTPLEGRT